MRDRDVVAGLGRLPRGWPLLIILFVIVCLAIQQCWAMTTVNSVLSNAFHPSPPAPGPSASWADMYSLAQREANRIDPNARLYEVDAWYPGISVLSSGYQNWDKVSPTSTLKTYFTYVRSSGLDIDIDMNDSALSTTLKVYPDNSTDQSVIESGKRLYQRIVQQGRWAPANLVRVKLSPREAMQATWQAAVDYARDKQGFETIGADPHISLYMESNRVAWYVEYSMIDPARPTRDRSQGPIAVDVVKSNYLVDAETGKILEANPTPTPTDP